MWGKKKLYEEIMLIPNAASERQFRDFVTNNTLAGWRWGRDGESITKLGHEVALISDNVSQRPRARQRNKEMNRQRG